MQFFEHQRAARAQSRRLSWLFAGIILMQIVLVNLGLLLPFLALAYFLGIPWQHLDLLLPNYFFVANTALSLLYILGGWWLESSRLAEGGIALARRIGAQPAQSLENNRGVWGADAAQIQLNSIVQELAIAANMAPPAAYLLKNETSINAFAAGWDSADSVICVTQGALDYLSRDELSGMVAHELSHIYEGDTRLNMRLAGMVLGLELLYNYGRAIAYGHDDKLDFPQAILGALLIATGWLGWSAARVMKAAISREREYLADARAIQYTRDNNGLGQTLRKVLWQQRRGQASFQAQHPAVQHMLLVGQGLSMQRWLQTHPPLDARIERLYGQPMAALKPTLAAAKADWKNPFASSAPLPFSTSPPSAGDRP